MATLLDSGRQWEIKEKEGGEPIYVKEQEKHHTLSIFKCKKVTVVVEGKINSVSMLDCVDTQVVLHTVINTVEVTNCKKVKLQITESCPSAAIDKTDSCMIFLMSDDAKKMQISTSKHSDTQITYMKGDEPVEVPVPEQFIHALGPDGKLESKVSSLYTS
mmetsp:Transcript_18653/g.33682  ORF Transcript_18653/g.33682 Transcript_18653/m.33682 type:complete len:160 (-) Transcript_18653:111-590(-)